MFKTGFDNYICEGDSIVCQIDGFLITARIVRDDCPDKPDERDEGFWPSANPDKPGYVGRENIKRIGQLTERAKAVMAAWLNDEWFYCGLVLSVERAGVTLTDSAASLWGIECNYPKDDLRPDYEPNSYLMDVANELLPDALCEARKAIGRLCQCQ
jgi:hypothetical protein